MEDTGHTVMVFTDVDGTLLDHDTYACKESLEGVRLLGERGIPLILVSSKTRYEMEELHRLLSLTSPFVFENGGGIVTPHGTGCSVEYLSTTTLQRVRYGIEEVRRITPVGIITMEEMTVDELADRTGLSTAQSALAKKRETSMPIVFMGDASEHIALIREILSGMGLQMIVGARFHHVLPADVDKGRALREIRDRAAVAHGEPVRIVGIGDGKNDIPMLVSADIPCLVRKKDGNNIDTGINDVFITRAAGPTGFTEAVKWILREKC